MKKFKTLYFTGLGILVGISSLLILISYLLTTTLIMKINNEQVINDSIKIEKKVITPKINNVKVIKQDVTTKTNIKPIKKDTTSRKKTNTVIKSEVIKNDVVTINKDTL